MQLFYLGTPPATFTEAEWGEHPAPRLLAGEPIFRVDGLLVFRDGAEFLRETQRVLDIQSSGRPVIRFGPVNLPMPRTGGGNILLLGCFATAEVPAYLGWMATRPRSNYQPIDCNFYDHFEQAIVSGEEVEIAYRLAGGRTQTVSASLRDLKTKKQEEYVQLANERWLRLDRIEAVNGLPAGDSCRF